MPLPRSPRTTCPRTAPVESPQLAPGYLSLRRQPGTCHCTTTGMSTTFPKRCTSGIRRFPARLAQVTGVLLELVAAVHKNVDNCTVHCAYSSPCGTGNVHNLSMNFVVVVSETAEAKKCLCQQRPVLIGMGSARWRRTLHHRRLQKNGAQLRRPGGARKVRKSRQKKTSHRHMTEILSRFSSANCAGSPGQPTR